MPLSRVYSWLKKESHEELELKTWHKVCFPVWLWKTLIHAKHEAFRFKYQTTKMTELDAKIGWISLLLYINTLIYYVVSLGGPFYYVNECGKGIHPGAHYWYLAYSMINLVCEFSFVFYIQKRLNDVNLLEINRWHYVELAMG